MHRYLKTLRKYKLLLSICELFYKRMNSTNQLQFYNLNDSFKLCEEWSLNIPNDYDVIIGVPRAGLMFANILACRFGRPLSTPDNFLRGEMWFSHDAPLPPKITKVLLVEDSIGAGIQINSAYQRIKEAFPQMHIEKAGLFVVPQSADKLDYSFAVKPEPNFFEWNIMTATWSWGEVVSGLEGVICLENPLSSNYFDDKYIHYVRSAKPLLIPTYPLKAIVTSRPEGLRKVTEKWLYEHNVKYEHLIMRPDDLTANFSNIVKMKSDVARAIKPFWVWESNYEEAKEIHQRARVPVLCTQTMTLFT